MTLAEATELDEKGAREYLEGIRWANRRICPHCGSSRSFALKGETTRPGLYKCSATPCRKPFTVTVGTIFHRSHISIRQWVIAFHLMSSSKKGVSAKQLQRNLGLGQYKSAWHLAHRIRLAMKQGIFGPDLQGIVEVDETYVGGKNPGGKRGRGSENKTPVVVLVERGGKARTKVVMDVTAKTLHAAMVSAAACTLLPLGRLWPS